MAENPTKIKLFNDLLPNFSTNFPYKLLHDFKQNVFVKTKIEQNKNHSKLPSFDSPQKQIMNLLTAIKELSSEEPEIFPIIFAANNQDYFFQLLISTYLGNLSDNSDDSTYIKNTIISTLINLLNYYDCKWETYEIIYEYLSTYLREKNVTPKLTSNLFMQILKIIKVLYQIRIDDTFYNDKVNYLPKSFFIHNGNGKMKRIMKQKILNIEDGLGILMWFYIKKPFVTDINEEHKSRIIQIIFKDNTKLEVCLDETYTNIYLNFRNHKDFHSIILKQWYMLELIFSSKTLFGKQTCSLRMTSFLNNRKIENFLIKKEVSEDLSPIIKSMNFYYNFFGISTSLFILNSSTKAKHGDFTLVSTANIINNDDFYLFCKFGAYDLLSANYYYKMLNNKLISFYAPFQSAIFNKKIIINDSLNGFNIQFINYLDSSRHIKQEMSHIKQNFIYVNNFYSNYSQLYLTIQDIGGINVLLPLFFLMIKLDKELMKKEIFEKIMFIIAHILKTSKENLLHANNTNFYYFLSRFLEIIPSYVYSDNIFKYLYLIYHEYMKLPLQNRDTSIQINSFISNIYLNIKIIRKFSQQTKEFLFPTFLNIFEEKQIEHHQLFKINHSQDNKHFDSKNILISQQIKEIFNLNFFTKFLYSINKETNNMFCCISHSPKNAKNVLNPSLKERIDYLSSIITSILNADDNSNKEMFYLFNFLCIDLVPCLQLFCINILINYIKHIKFNTEENKNAFLERSRNNNLQLIIIHLIKEGIWDVKLQVLHLIIEFTYKIDYFFQEKDFSLLKEAFFVNEEYNKIIDINIRKRGNSVSNINHINLGNKKYILKRSNSMYKKLKQIDYETLLINTKSKEFDVQNQFEQLKEFNFSNFFCEFIKKRSQKIKKKEKYFHEQNIKPKTQLLVINDSLITLYKKLFLWSTSLSLSPYITNQVLSIILMLLKNSFSFKLLQLFLLDLTEYLNLSISSHISRSNELFHFLLGTAAHFLSLKEFKYNRRNSLYLKANHPISIDFSKVLISLHDILYKMIYLNIKFNSNIKILNDLLKMLTYQQIISIECNSFCAFIEEIFYEVHKLYFQLQQNQLILSSKITFANDNLAKFVNIVFEYVVIQNNSFSLLTNFKDYIDIQNHYSPFTVPCFLLLWVDISDKSFQFFNKLHLNKKMNKYLLFTSIYYKYQTIWNIYKYLPEIHTHNDNQLHKKMKILDQAIEQFVFCSKKQNYKTFAKEIQFLFLPNEKSNKYICFPLIKIFFQFLIITLLVQNEKRKLKFWIQEFEKMLLFTIIASLNCQNQLRDEQQTILLSIIAFGLNFLVEQFQSTKEHQKLYNESIYIVFYLLYNILTHKRFISLYKKSALYLLFFEYILDKNKNNLIIHCKTFGIKITNHENYNQFYDEKGLLFWKKYLWNNDIIKKILLNFFEKKEYLATVSKRYAGLTKIIPQYEKTVDLSKQKLINILQLKANDLYEVKISQNWSKSINVATSLGAKVVLGDFAKQKVIRKRNILLNANGLKKTITSLFKFRGCWSDKHSFYSSSFLPSKIVNHYSSDMTMPLLTPVLNKSYPLLNKIDNNFAYLISFDVESFFRKTKNKYKQQLNRNHKNSIEYNKVYKQINSEKYWENLVNYKSKLSKNELFEGNNNLQFSDPSSIPENNLETENKSHIERDNFMVCLVKQTYHIKGYLEHIQNALFFKSVMCPNNYLSVDGKFSDLSLKCRGSFHRDAICSYNYPKQIQILFKKIKYIFIRNYYFERRAIEIFTSENKGYYFHFQTNKNLCQFLNIIHKCFQPFILENNNVDSASNMIGYYNSLLVVNEYNHISFESLYNKWRKEHIISTFHFISWLNILVGRSYKDINQYPLFPWPIINYTSKQINSSSQLNIRNFKLSIDDIDVNEKSAKRKNYLKHIYKMKMIDNKENSFIKEKGKVTLSSLLFPNSSLESKINCFHANQYAKFNKINKNLYYNSSTYLSWENILSYLIRIYPFKSFFGISKYTKIEFNSFDESFLNSISSRTDFSELTPEFFYMSEILMSSSPVQIQNVLLPKWCKNKPYELISTFRRVIEKDPNKNIHRWMRMIFNESKNNLNNKNTNSLFLSKTKFQEKISIDNEDEILKINYLNLANKGIIPFPKITRIIKKKYTSKFEQLPTNKNSTIIIKDIHYKAISNPIKLFPIYFQQPKLYSHCSEIKMLSNDLSIYTFNLIQNEDQFSIQEKTIHNTLNSEISSNYLYRKSLYNNVFVLYQDNSIIKGGYSDGSVKYFYKKENKYYIDTILLDSNTSPITSIEYVSKNNIIIFGLQQGKVMAYKILNSQFTTKLIKVLNDHSDEIILITFNHNLGIVVTSSYDEYIFVYTFPNFKCIRSFHFSNFYANKIVISTNPLPMFVFYCEEVSEFKLFTINGSAIETAKDNILREKKMTSFANYTDFKYVDHLVAGTEDGYVIIMKFPRLIVETIINVFEGKVKFVIPVLDGFGVLCYAKGNTMFKLVYKKLHDNSIQFIEKIKYMFNL